MVSIPGIADSGPTGSSADQFVAAVDRLFGLHAPPLLVMESAEEETGHRHPLADALAEAGYDVTAVDGGFKEWSATGHAVVSGSAYEISS